MVWQGRKKYYSVFQFENVIDNLQEFLLILYQSCLKNKTFLKLLALWKTILSCPIGQPAPSPYSDSFTQSDVQRSVLTIHNAEYCLYYFRFIFYVFPSMRVSWRRSAIFDCGTPWRSFNLFLNALIVFSRSVPGWCLDAVRSTQYCD